MRTTLIITTSTLLLSHSATAIWYRPTTDDASLIAIWKWFNDAQECNHIPKEGLKDTSPITDVNTLLTMSPTGPIDIAGIAIWRGATKDAEEAASSSWLSWEGIKKKAKNALNNIGLTGLPNCPMNQYPLFYVDVKQRGMHFTFNLGEYANPPYTQLDFMTIYPSEQSKNFEDWVKDAKRSTTKIITPTYLDVPKEVKEAVVAGDKASVSSDKASAADAGASKEEGSSDAAKEPTKETRRRRMVKARF